MTTTFADRLEQLDVTLFEGIKSQSNQGDKTSWLALHRAVRKTKHSFVYLEIGSYRGGSIQPYLLDPRCRVIYSIDKRSTEQVDDRGPSSKYEGNTTAAMLDNLRAVDAGQLGKVVCFDSDAKDLDPADIADAPDICFIDGQHTRAAVLDDSAFCRRVCAKDAVIYFHDANVVHRAIAKIVDDLTRAGTQFTALKLSGLTFAIVLGDSPVTGDGGVRDLSSDGTDYLRRMRMQQLRERVGRFVPAFVKPALRVARW